MDSYRIIRGPDHHTPDGVTHPGEFSAIQRVSDNAGIPFDPANRDCRRFLFDWMNGAIVKRPNGNPYPFTLAHRTELKLDAVEPLGDGP